MRADRDQWGVFYNIGDHSIAQEDGTRSFLDGLIKCIQAFRDMHEHETTDATKKIGEI